MGRKKKIDNEEVNIEENNNEENNNENIETVSNNEIPIEEYNQIPDAVQNNTEPPNIKNRPTGVNIENNIETFNNEQIDNNVNNEESVENEETIEDTTKNNEENGEEEQIASMNRFLNENVQIPIDNPQAVVSPQSKVDTPVNYATNVIKESIAPNVVTKPSIKVEKERNTFFPRRAKTETEEMTEETISLSYYFHNLEFSKLITIMVTILFGFTWVVSWIMWYIKGTLPSELLSFISTPFGVVVSFYMGKSCLENVVKIRTSNDEEQY